MSIAPLIASAMSIMIIAGRQDRQAVACDLELIGKPTCPHLVAVAPDLRRLRRALRQPEGLAICPFGIVVAAEIRW